ncbi:isopenicillin N synthase family dioxygenase [Methylorubrum populi]|uniref:2-oxoglutarate-dependent ethylene/succinate-forming enzyme n=1 Tax=Methylorubrum populi TaxID=223967 RepID=A0A833J9G7_9HYPH|nr:2-oxoglutarate and iron-dependent oxygenase domain-containing protein [Methylorubrum populi]KAB7786959.1 putative 2-Oxobutyrate oxidase [Methylorubrum populi]
MRQADLPIVDIAPFIHGDAAARAGVGRAFGHALETTGFAVVVGHGIPERLANDVYDTMKRYFAQPLSVKSRDAAPEKTKGRGYLPVGIESVARTLQGETPPDLCEALVFNAPHREGDAARPNIWPAEPPELRGLVEAWRDAILRLTGQLTELSALALDLPQDYFAPWFADPALTLRFVHYPDQAEPPMPGQLRYGAHHDYGGLTILRQDAAPGGLQVADRDGTWFEAGVVPDSFVINVGDLLARWTNERWRSTLHRVSNPDRGLTGSSARLSMVAFTAPNEGSEVACLPSCCDAANPPRYAPVKAGEYIQSKLRASMDLTARA